MHSVSRAVLEVNVAFSISTLAVNEHRLDLAFSFGLSVFVYKRKAPLPNEPLARLFT
jgi:hypothetical protein